jgi:hypothetical protein
MSPEAQRIAIAEACGWKVEHRYKGSRRYCEIVVFSKDGFEEFGVFPGDLTSAHGKKVMNDGFLPDYLNDLNAMHEAEKVLINAGRDGDWRGWESYTLLLDEAIGSDDRHHATAAQRAEAFLRTIGKWEESA